MTTADAASARDALDAGLAEAARRRYAIDAVKAAQAQEAGADEQGERASGADAMNKHDPSEAQRFSPIENLVGRSELAIAWDEGLPEFFRLREEAVLRADLTQLSDASGGWSV